MLAIVKYFRIFRAIYIAMAHLADMNFDLLKIILGQGCHYISELMMGIVEVYGHDDYLERIAIVIMYVDIRVSSWAWGWTQTNRPSLMERLLYQVFAWLKIGWYHGG